MTGKLFRKVLRVSRGFHPEPVERLVSCRDAGLAPRQELPAQTPCLTCGLDHSFVFCQRNAYVVDRFELPCSRIVPVMPRFSVLYLGEAGLADRTEHVLKSRLNRENQSERGPHIFRLEEGLQVSYGCPTNEQD